MYSGVTYWRKHGKERYYKVRDVCFGALRRVATWPDTIRYVAPVAVGTTKEEVVWWIAALKLLLPEPKRFNLKLVRLKQPDDLSDGMSDLRLVCIFDSRGLNYIQALCYLSLFRYVHEYTPLLKLLYARREDLTTAEALFSALHEEHAKVQTGKIQYWGTDHDVVNGFNRGTLPPYAKWIKRMTTIAWPSTLHAMWRSEGYPGLAET